MNIAKELVKVAKILSGAITLEGWLGALDNKQRESVFAEMRRLGNMSDHYAQEARRLSPRGGTISVGAADFDAFIKGEAIQEFLRHVRRGVEPTEAADKAKKYVRESVAKHNSKRKDSTWQRWEGTGDTMIEDAMRALLNAAK